MKVRIVQLLCPNRHCVVAIAYESPDGSEIPKYGQELIEAIQSQRFGIHPWCGICQSRTLHPEDRPTNFQTLEEANPTLRANERAQAETREYFRRSKH